MCACGVYRESVHVSVMCVHVVCMSECACECYVCVYVVCIERVCM